VTNIAEILDKIKGLGQNDLEKVNHYLASISEKDISDEVFMTLAEEELKANSRVYEELAK